MPSWDFIHIDVSGEPDALRNFAETVSNSNSPLDFNTIVPQPEMEDAHEWRVEHWGVTSNACRCEVEEFSGSLLYSFETSWCEPMPLFKAMANKFPALSFEFEWQHESEFEVDENNNTRSLWHTMSSKGLSEEDIRKNVSRQFVISEHWND